MAHDNPKKKLKGLELKVAPVGNLDWTLKKNVGTLMEKKEKGRIGRSGKKRV